MPRADARRALRGALLCLAGLTALASAPAPAQERGFRLHRYEGTTAGGWQFLAERPWYSSLRFAAVGVTLDYSRQLLVPRLATGRGELVPILDHALVGHLDLAGSLLDRVTVGASLPLTLFESGSVEPVSQVGPLRGISLGDPRLSVWVRLLGQPERDPVSVHLGADVWIPIGRAALHQGDTGVRVSPRAVLAGAAFGLGRWSVDLGYHHRPYASFGPPALGMTAAPELRAGAALGAALLGERLHVGPEARFSVQVQGENAFAVNGMSLELLAGAQLLLFEHVTVGVAVGTAVLGAAGTPDLRALLRLGWAPRRDGDGDGVPNLDDACPDERGVSSAERTASGCPGPAPLPPDADGDGVPDAADRCPLEPEAPNGVRDQDGCPEYALEPGSPLARVLAQKPGPAPGQSPASKAGPPEPKAAPPEPKAAPPEPKAAPPEPESAPERGGARAAAFATADADADGVPDEADRCPVQPEDHDGFEDDDGCPEPDNDQDGVADGDDQCPLEAEVRNGVADADGCPDAAEDADRDGVPDGLDRCPFEAETADGVRDADGCPELTSSSPALVRLLAAAPEPAPGPAAPAAPEAALPPAQPSPRAALDGDGDGVPDEADRCPLTKEDADGFEDEDGCPEPDNDQDGVADANDRCPLEAEVVNGNRDEDGCPDVPSDADRDGVDYDADRCPLEPGDSTDGCPRAASPSLVLPGFFGVPAAPPSGLAPGVPSAAPAQADLDRDGVPDEADRCPVTKEDADGFEDEDGCPEPDNDRDGVPDGKDKCPAEAEVVNGNRDDDGCPDLGAGAVVVQVGEVRLEGVVRFAAGSARLQPVSYPLLKQVAATLRAAAAVSVEVQGHTDDVGSAQVNIRLSRQRAEAIVGFLVKAGVPAQRLTAAGYGPTRPRASNKTPEGREQNRRVEFRILGEAK